MQQLIKPYHMTPCIVAEKNWNTKEDKGSPMNPHSVAVAVGKRAHLRSK